MSFNDRGVLGLYYSELFSQLLMRIPRMALSLGGSTDAALIEMKTPALSSYGFIMTNKLHYQ